MTPELWLTPAMWLVTLFAEFVIMALLLAWTIWKRIKAEMKVRELEEAMKMTTYPMRPKEYQQKQREMAFHPDNPYKIVPDEPAEWDGELTDTFLVLKPDGSTYGRYQADGAQWWAAHLYHVYLNDERTAEMLLTGQVT